MAGSQPEQPILRVVLRDAAERLGVPDEVIAVDRIDPEQWRDTCLDCPKPDEICGDMVTPGFRVVVSARGQQLVYHTDEVDKARRCDLRATCEHISGWGGHARRLLSVDAADLPTSEAADLRDLLGASDFYDLNPTYIDPDASTEDPQTRLGVEAHVEHLHLAHEVYVHGDRAPLPRGLQELLSWFWDRLPEDEAGEIPEASPSSLTSSDE